MSGSCLGIWLKLLQQEYDHLDGILAVMRAIDGKSYSLTSEKQFIDFAR